MLTMEIMEETRGPMLTAPLVVTVMIVIIVKVTEKIRSADVTEKEAEIVLMTTASVMIAGMITTVAIKIEKSAIMVQARATGPMASSSLLQWEATCRAHLCHSRYSHR